jgi:hypothetical protein
LSALLGVGCGPGEALLVQRGISDDEGSVFRVEHRVAGAMAQIDGIGRNSAFCMRATSRRLSSTVK